MIPPKISLIKTFLKLCRLNSENKPQDRCLKHSLKISKVDVKITESNPDKMKKENGKKEIIQISSLNPNVRTKEIVNTCFLFFKTNSSPALRLIKKPFQNIINIKLLKIIKPKIKPTDWAKIKNQTILADKNIINGDIKENVFGDILMAFLLKQSLN